MKVRSTQLDKNWIVSGNTSLTAFHIPTRCAPSFVSLNASDSTHEVGTWRGKSASAEGLSITRNGGAKKRENSASINFASFISIPLLLMPTTRPLSPPPSDTPPAPPHHSPQISSVSGTPSHPTPPVTVPGRET